MCRAFLLWRVRSCRWIARQDSPYYCFLCSLWLGGIFRAHALEVLLLPWCHAKPKLTWLISQRLPHTLVHQYGVSNNVSIGILINRRVGAEYDIAIVSGIPSHFGPTLKEIFL